MDGYMDVCDALSSHAPRERKLEIMKDPRSGAFAVIYCAVYILLQAAAFYSLYTLGAARVFCFVFVLSRVLSGVLALFMKNARTGGMLYALTKNAARKISAAVCILWGVCALAAIYFTAGAVFSGAAFAVSAVWTCVYLLFAKRTFGGATGDTAGFFLQMAELFCAFALIAGAAL